MEFFCASIKQGVHSGVTGGGVVFGQLENDGGRGAWKCHEADILADALPDVLQSGSHGVVGQLGTVVLATEVA